ncbi:putative RNA recognition motif domain, LSM-interacting domain, tetratricopeptide-like helical [Lupinus albus]|uniref:Putative RNA recognition motif domain, LSM-interacting domain, tetratricopeptide-like helical n=1 Tax=Lupinus albus TaxID=3870 RepID=A0A6A4P4G8_LUPAL|nr:putative RNA recognition motif domain, LSM-interacting domain, tetratricopeptide-like helical [Lupinus albus]
MEIEMEETLTHSEAEAALEKEETLHDSDSDSDSDSELNLQIQSLEAELAVNPSHYDSHFQYIKLLRRMGDVEKLSKAREAMSELFPLSPSMWQEWIKDEVSLKPDFSAVINLYERALFDYLSVSLWCDYINFVQEFDSIPGTSKVRDLFETALAAAGLHISQGSLLWESYRLYEQAILLTIDESDTEAKDKQIQQIRTLFHRQLSIPLADMTSTLTAYKIWEAEQGNDLHEVDINPHVASSYQRALDMYNARKHFEQHICNQEDIPDSQRLQNYMNYLKFEQSSGTPARVQVLYERAITDFPISPDLWLDYTRYLDKTLKVGNIVSNVYSRATKNCPWIGELWVRYLLCLERSNASEKDLVEVFEKSLLCTFSTYDEYLDLFLTRVDGLRRRMTSTYEEDLLDYKIIRQTFQRASDYLSPHLKNTEVLLHMHAYWAHLETKLGKDITAARGVWENFLKICGSMLEAWKGYITMEVELGHINETRSIYKRCYSKRFSGTGSEDICNSWLRFEREFGKLEDLDHALLKVTPRLEELKLFRIQQESKLAEENENNPKRNARDKRKLGPDITDEQSPAKLLRDGGRKITKAPNENKHQVQNSSQVTKVEVVNQKNNISDNFNEQHSTTRKKRAYSDQHTAFISNIHPTANYEHIRNFFSDVGGVVAIRILHDKFTGKSRGLAYVDFIDDVHLASAVAKNKHRLLGKKLSIARSDPKRGGKETSDPNALKEHVSKETDGTSKEDGKVSSKKIGNDNVQLKGKNTFAVPRNVRPLGFPANKPKAEEEGDEKPKSNDEFRKMFIR